MLRFVPVASVIGAILDPKLRIYFTKLRIYPEVTDLFCAKRFKIGVLAVLSGCTDEMRHRHLQAREPEEGYRLPLCHSLLQGYLAHKEQRPDFTAVPCLGPYVGPRG